MTELTARELLIMLYQSALDSVDGRYLVNHWCQQNADRQSTFTHCIAIGKAAAAMLQGAHDSLPGLKKSLLICPPAKLSRQLKKNKNIHCIASSHPIPDERSIEAGQALLAFVSALQEGDHPLFLISGGSSALVEIAVDDISLQQLQAINRYLLASGKDIHQINRWRQRFSQIKGGGLLHWLAVSELTQLLLSDVKDDRLEFIGSGLLVDAPTAPDEDDYLSGFSVAVDDRPAATVDVNSFVIGNNRQAMQAVYDAALSEGLAAFMYEDFLQGEAVEVADELYLQLKDAVPGIHIWGGETTVSLPDKPGVGGRNLTLALAFSRHLSAMPGLYLLAAGTDGVDGNSNCAGGVVSEFTAKKASRMGFDIDREIAKANAGIVLMASDDLVPGENSNTNVMDLVIAYKTE